MGRLWFDRDISEGRAYILEYVRFNPSGAKNEIYQLETLLCRALSMFIINRVKGRKPQTLL
jgi:hypothetical protein